MSDDSPAAVANEAVPQTTLRSCANCGAHAPERFCGSCGQETRGPFTTSEFVRETLEYLLSWESKAWRTLVTLVFAPGALTAEYLAGRRVHYVRPLRLYLWVSVLVIAFTEAFGLRLGLSMFGGAGVYLFEPGTHAQSEAQQGHAGQLRPMKFILEHLDTQGIRRFKSMSNDDQQRFLQAQRHGSVQYFLLFLVPAVALVMKLCYLNRKRLYADHLVFCLHAQSFLLIIVLSEAEAPPLIASLLSLWVFAYFYTAAKRVYGGSWPETLLRGTTAMALHLSIFVLTGSLLVYLVLEA